MRVVRHTDPGFEKRLRELTAPSSLFDRQIEDRTRAILEQVHQGGDAALAELTQRFDGAKLSPQQFGVTQADFMAASLQADESLRSAVAEAAKNIATFARKSLRQNWQTRNSHGAVAAKK